MTVAELIAELQKLDPTLPVLATYADTRGTTACRQAESVKVRRDACTPRGKGVVIE